MHKTDEGRLILSAYPYPEIRGIDEVFSTLETDPKLLAEAERRGFYMGDTKANRMFNHLFYHGGSIRLKSDVDSGYVRRAVPYIKALIRSFAPKHEEKEAVCAMILDEIADDIA